jgi:hypothetical protein
MMLRLSTRPSAMMSALTRCFFMDQATNQQRQALDSLHEEYKDRVGLLVGDKLDRRRLDLLHEVLYELEFGGAAMDLSAEDGRKRYLTVALCALGPLDAGPPDQDLINHFAAEAEPVLVRLPEHFDQVREIEGRLAEARRDEDAATQSNNHDRLRQAKDLREELERELGGRKDDNPAVAAAVWYGLWGPPRLIPATGHARAAAWSQPFPMGEVWLTKILAGASSLLDFTLGYWNEKLAGSVVDGVAKTIVDHLLRPRPETIEQVSALDVTFTPIPGAEDPPPDPIADTRYAAAFAAARVGVKINDRTFKRLPGERFVFHTAAFGFQKGLKTIAPPGARVVIRCGSKEAYISTPGRRASQVRLNEANPILLLKAEQPTEVVLATCQCGAQNCKRDHTLERWKMGKSLRDFLYQLIKGPMAKAENTPPGSKAWKKVAPKAVKAGMFHQFLASGEASANSVPRRLDRCTIWKCCSAQCKNRRPSVKAAWRDDLLRLHHGAGCQMDPNDAHLVEDEWFISTDPGQWSLRPYWGTKNLSAGKLSNASLLAMMEDPAVAQHLLPIRKSAQPDPPPLRQWHGEMTQEEVARDPLLHLLSAHFCEHSVEWEKDLSSRYVWLTQAVEGRAPYKKLEPLLTDWSPAKQAIARNRWHYLLVNGYPGRFYTPKLPPRAQYELILSCLPEPLRSRVEENRAKHLRNSVLLLEDGGVASVLLPTPEAYASLDDWYIDVQRRDLETDPLLRLLSSHFKEHPPDWQTSVRAKFFWLVGAADQPPNTVNPYRPVVSEIIKAWWGKVEKFIAANRWHFLLVHGYPASVTPPRPLLGHEQYNLILDHLPAGMRKARKLVKIRPPKYLWTSNSSQFNA